MIYFLYKFAVCLGLSGNGLSVPRGISGMAQSVLKDLFLRRVTHMPVKLVLAVILKLSKGRG